MTFSKLSLSALVLGAALGGSLAPAFADAGVPDQRLSSYLQSIGQAPAAMVEGRQAAAITKVAAPSAAETFVIDRNPASISR